jgi:hypothetical protein
MNPQNLRYRSNPLSTPQSTVNAYVENVYETAAVALTATVNAGATSIAWTASAPANNVFSYLRAVVTDGEGNEATMAFNVANIAGGATMNTTALNANTDWTVQIFWAEGGTAFDPIEMDSANDLIVGAKGDVVRTYSTVKAIGTLQVWAELWKGTSVAVANAVVADTGTAAFGNVTENTVAYAIVTFKNTGTSPLRITAIPPVTGEGSLSAAFGDTPSLPLIIAGGETSAAYVKVNVDTTVGAGAITPIVLTITNNTTNVSYVVNFSATLV